MQEALGLRTEAFDCRVRFWADPSFFNRYVPCPLPSFLSPQSYARYL